MKARHARGAAPGSGDAPTVRGGRGVKGEAQAHGVSYRDSSGLLALCVRRHELRNAVMLRVARMLRVQP